jgi:hypothetical protein
MRARAVDLDLLEEYFSDLLLSRGLREDLMIKKYTFYEHLFCSFFIRGTYLRPDFLDDPFLSGLLRWGEEELDDLESRRSRLLILRALIKI